MNHMTFADLQRRVAAWTAKNFPDRKNYQPLLGALEELGELAHAHLKQDQGIRGTAAEHDAAKADAIADVIIYLTDYCEIHKFDLQTVVEVVWAQVERRDWKKFPKNGRDE